MKEQAKISAARLQGMIGRTVEVLLEGPSGETDLLLQGRMETQAPDIDGHVLINDAGEKQPAAGEFYNVEITESLEYDLIGRIL
jgi:ribosomal protein S12 methylthiotransferase